MGMIYRPGIPITHNLVADCMRAAMLSAIRTHAPHTPVTLEDLRHCASYAKGEGTDIAQAALAFKQMGYAAQAYASTLERVPPRSLKLAHRFNLEVQKSLLSADDLIGKMKTGHLVIFAIETATTYPGALNGSHAVLMTGYPANNQELQLAFHETMWRDYKNPDGQPYKKLPISTIERGRAAHDYHTVILRPLPGHQEMTAGFIKRIRTSPVTLERIRREKLEQQVLEQAHAILHGQPQCPVQRGEPIHLPPLNSRHSEMHL